MEQHNIFDKLMAITRNSVENSRDSYFYREFGSTLENHIRLNREATISEFNDFARTNTYTTQQWCWFLDLMRAASARGFPDATQEILTNLHIEILVSYLEKLEVTNEKVITGRWWQTAKTHFDLADLFEKKGDFIQRDSCIKCVIGKKIVRDRKQWLVDFFQGFLYLLLTFTPKIVCDIFLFQINNSLLLFGIKLIFAFSTVAMAHKSAWFVFTRLELWKDASKLHRQLILERRIDPQLKSASLRRQCQEFDDRLARFRYFDDLFNPIKIIRSSLARIVNFNH